VRVGRLCRWLVISGGACISIFLGLCGIATEWDVGDTLSINLVGLELAVELPLVSGENNVQVFIHGDLVIYVVNIVPEDLHLVKDVAEKGINHHIGAPLVAEGAQPPLVLRVHLNVRFQVKALQMGADLTSSWDRDWEHCDRVRQIDCHLFCFLVLHFRNLIV
jgi:hypothetical protein